MSVFLNSNEYVRIATTKWLRVQKNICYILLKINNVNFTSMTGGLVPCIMSVVFHSFLSQRPPHPYLQPSQPSLWAQYLTVPIAISCL